MSVGLSIVLDRSEVLPGDEVSGFVSVDLPVGSSMEGMSLEIRLRGIEKSMCAIQATVMDDRNSTSPNVAYEKREFLHTSYTLRDYENDLYNKNRKLFPFCVILPSHLPISLNASLSGASGGECSISYSLECVLLEFNTQIQQTSTDFIVRRKPTSDIVSFPVYIVPKPHPLSFCNLWSLGEILIGVYCPTCVLYPNQPFRFTYLIQRHNKTYAEVRAVELSLIEVVSWTAHSVKREEQTTLYHTRIESENISFINEIPSVLSRETENEEIVQEWEKIPQLEEKTIKGIFQNFNNSIRGNLKTNFIEVKYYFHFKVCTQFGTNNPSVNLPVFVHASSPSNHEDLIASTEAIALPSSINGIDVARFLNIHENTFMMNDYLATSNHHDVATALSTPIHHV